MKRKICVATGSRAEYVLLRRLLRLLAKEPDVELQLLVTGSHLDRRFGYTYQDILNDGFKADELIDLELKDDSPGSVSEGLGRSTLGFSRALARLKPDLLVLLGDRYEILGAASAALLQRVPLAHIFGGDITEGAFDESIRHAISKMAQLHFTTNEGSRLRLIRMGERPELVHTVGAPNLDAIQEVEWLDRAALERRLGMKLRAKNFLVTFHPETLLADSRARFRALLDVLDEDYPAFGWIFTKANADPQGQVLNEMAEAFVSGRPNAVLHPSLGSQAYLSMMRAASAVLGNSSSGIYEAPALQVPTVNIGDRQKGRLFADSVVACAGDRDSIRAAIAKALALDCSRVATPYGTPGVAERILERLRSVQDFRALLQKGFYE